MRTRTVIVIQEGTGEVYCNDPRAILHSVSHARPRDQQLQECGCCGFYHLSTFRGDCRDDNERLYLVL